MLFSGAQERYTTGPDKESGEPVDNEERAQFDGYLLTYFTLDVENGWDNTIRHRRFQDFTLHELYCAGHMYEAAVAYTRATAYKDLSFLNVAVRNADMIKDLHKVYCSDSAKMEV